MEFQRFRYQRVLGCVGLRFSGSTFQAFDATCNMKAVERTEELRSSIPESLFAEEHWASRITERACKQTFGRKAYQNPFL